MQVVCGNCQLSFQAPEGAAGLMCPICRSPLRPAQAGSDGAAKENLVEWSGGSLDNLVAYLAGPATAVRIEVLPATGDSAVGEVHLLAGGVSEALYAGKSTDDALDKLRGVQSPRFRLEARLPNPVDGDLGSPGPDSGTLDSRPLAHLMRYCEQYVITCGIEVWRGSETARVEYRKGGDQRRHRRRHRRPRAAGGGDAVGVGQLPADHAEARDARVGAQGPQGGAGRGGARACSRTGCSARKTTSDTGGGPPAGDATDGAARGACARDATTTRSRPRARLGVARDAHHLRYARARLGRAEGGRGRCGSRPPDGGSGCAGGSTRDPAVVGAGSPACGHRRVGRDPERQQPERDQDDLRRARAQDP